MKQKILVVSSITGNFSRVWYLNYSDYCWPLSGGKSCTIIKKKVSRLSRVFPVVFTQPELENNLFYVCLSRDKHQTVKRTHRILVVSSITGSFSRNHSDYCWALSGGLHVVSRITGSFSRKWSWNYSDYCWALSGANAGSIIKTLDNFRQPIGCLEFLWSF